MSFSKAAMENTLELTLEQKNQLKIEGLDIPQGTQTDKIKCPVCGEGGSFSVKRDGVGLLYKCFRAKCGVEGAVPSKIARSVLSIVDGDKKGKEGGKFVPSPFVGELRKIPRAVKNLLISMYQLNGRDIARYGFKYNKPTDRIYMPIYNFWGSNTGAVMKKLPDSKYTGPKAVSHWEINDPIRLHFPPTSIEETGIIVVVEDILSASKIAPILRSCALLGCSLGDKQAAFLATHFKKMVVLLDPDAVAKAASISRKYSGMFENGAIVRALDKDPKDTDYRQLEHLLIKVIGGK